MPRDCFEKEKKTNKKKKTVPYCCFGSASICMWYSSVCSHEYGLNTHWENTCDPQLPSDVTTGFLQHVNEVPAHFPLYLYHMFVCTLSHDLFEKVCSRSQECLSNPRWTVWMLCAEHVIRSECDSSDSLCSLFPSMSLERWSTDGSANTILCIVCNVLGSHFIQFIPLQSQHLPVFPFAFLLPAPPLHLLPPIFFFFFFISNAADKEVEDYYTRKRHLPDLAARGTLPLHVLKLSQEQVGT